jgi:hypothetical protein
VTIVAGDKPFADTTEATIEPGLYWTPGNIRYTINGTDPNSDSPLYNGPIIISSTTTLKVASFDSKGKPGQITTKQITVNDKTPPSIRSVVAMSISKNVQATFSEPLDPASVRPADFKIDPGIGVEVATLSHDHRTVTLTLSKLLDRDMSYKLRASGVTDASPGHNRMSNSGADFVAHGPVFTMDDVKPEQRGEPIRNVAGLPVKSGDSWTINVFVRTDKQPANHTIIAGFGKCEQTSGGNGRYLAKFAPGIHFWSHNQDVESRTRLDLDHWQMLSATYDGTTLRVYKDAKQISEGQVKLSDDENIINIAPKDPWDHRYQFSGDIRNLSIWGTALEEGALKSLQESGPKE